MYSFLQVDSKLVIEKKAAVKEAFVALCSDETFRRLLVTQPKAVVARAEAWQRALTKALK